MCTQYITFWETNRQHSPYIQIFDEAGLTETFPLQCFYIFRRNISAQAFIEKRAAKWKDCWEKPAAGR